MTEPIRPRDTSGDLLGRLAVAGAGLLVATLDGIERGELVAAAAARRRRQPGAQAHRRGRPRRLGGAGAPRGPAGPRLHAGAGRLDHVPRGDRLGLGPVEPVDRLSEPLAPGRGPRRPARGAGRHRRRPGRSARRGPAGREAADGGRRLGPRCPRPRRRRRLGMTAPPRHDGPTGGRRRPPRRGKPQPDAAAAGSPSTCCGPSTSATPTPTSPCRGCSATAASRAATPRSPPSSPTARCAVAGTYDAVLAACVDRPLDQVDPPVLDLLRLGAHQLLAMRVPPHAAVGATVELARAVAGEGRSSFVNAVLRKVGRQDLASWLAEVAPAAGTDPLGHLAVAHSHPRWVVSALRDALGGDLAETAALLAADNEPAAGHPRRPARPQHGRRPASPTEPSRPAGRRTPRVLPAGDPGRLAAVRDGRAGVQDEGSQLVALALAAAPLDGRDERWLDLCAGPGGKAALLAALGAERGARLLAAELAPHRAGLVRQHARRRPADVVVGGRPRARPGRPARSTGCSSTRRAPASARCGAGRRRAGAASPRTCRRWPPCSATCSARRWTRSGRAAWSPTSPARRTSAETRPVVSDVLRRRPGRRAGRRAAAAAGSARPRRRPARAAVAAPARHRRDVPRPAAQDLIRAA